MRNGYFAAIVTFCPGALAVDDGQVVLFVSALIMVAVVADPLAGVKVNVTAFASSPTPPTGSHR